MRLLRLCVLALACCCAAAAAITQDEVIAGAAPRYRQQMAEIASAHMLDRDPVFLARVLRIVRPLIAQVGRERPETAHWAWEIHSTDEDDETAYCMAGGKMLLSQAYVNKLGLSDGELAMVLSHEIEHAVLQHNLREFEQAIRLDPRWASRPLVELEDAVDNDGALVAKLAELNLAQEVEADRAGLEMAWRAGWPASSLALYFRKAMQASAYPHAHGAGHPAPSQRWRQAHALAERLELMQRATPASHD